MTECRHRCTQGFNCGGCGCEECGAYGQPAHTETVLISVPRGRTDADWHEHMRLSYGHAYEIVMPPTPGSPWEAYGRYGSHDRLYAWSPSELLEDLRDHHYSHYGAGQGR
jgi:hypothetical protein